ncbi:hypothetical protein [Anaerotignum sp.]|uniref:hypothetical protein n=1 Tax=Anaerotignum sp. TaxID=2039241 RepID=UPI00289ADCFF|nr:hypothetical protein [Anaerotignum sp.]
MKKFRLAAAVSVAVLTMSVQAMAAPLNCNISSGSSCPTSKTFTNAVKGIQTSNSTQNSCFNFTNIESVLSQLNCNNGSSVKGASYVKGTTTTKGFNCTTATKGSNCTTSTKAASRVKGASTNNCTGSNCTTSSNCTTGSKCTTTTKAVKGASFSNASNCFTGYNCTGSNCNTGCNK